MSKRNNRDRVAQLAGVSSATVSRVYNNPDRVSESKKQAVLEAAAQIGYAPDKSASALRRKGTGQITLVRMEKPFREWYWGSFSGAKWFFTDVLEGVMEVVDQSMYRINVRTVKDTEELLAINWEKECDGIIFYDVDDAREVEAINKLSVPTVISHHCTHFDTPLSCSTDNEFGGFLAGEALFKKGYKNPVFISYLPSKVTPNRDRYTGFNRAFQEQGFDTVPQLLDEPGKKGGYKLCQDLIPQIKEGKVDAIGVVNDMTAIGVIQCLQDNNLKPGKDVGLTAYDNMPLNYVLPFELCSVDMQPSLIYKEAANLLLEKLRSGDDFEGPGQKIVLPRLNLGDSI